MCSSDLAGLVYLSPAALRKSGEPAARAFGGALGWGTDAGAVLYVAIG